LVFDSPDFDQQKFFIEQFYNFLHLGCEAFHQCMEEAYSAWNDDEELILKEVLRTVASANAEGTIRLSEQDDPEGEEVKLGIKLFEDVATNTVAYESQIADITDNWDPSRIAVLDLIAIKMALAEFLHFPMIPLKVTINEYLDIIKDYSTPSSSRFLNGILDKMRKKLETSGEIRKAGRGLRDN
jgi:transcription antitermination protein NusB